MPSPRIEILEDAIKKLQDVKHLMEKELHYDWPMTDELQVIIEALQHDLGETEQHDKERGCE